MKRRKQYDAVGGFRPPVRDRILLALRPGAMETQALYERMSGTHSVEMALLIKDGLVIKQGESKETMYKLTAQGRAACPRWRDILRTQPEGLDNNQVHNTEL